MDPPQDSAREPMPEKLQPMLAKLAKDPPDDEHYAYEIKWDGIRAVIYGSGGRINIETRNLIDVTAQFPELSKLGRAIGSHEVVLDGEIVGIDPESGIPSFQRIQQRMGLKAEGTIKCRAQAFPVTLMLFDILYLDGHSVMHLSYVERRKLLELLELSGPAWQTPKYHTGDGKGLLKASAGKGLEGIVAKRFDSSYVPNQRGNAWLKLKLQQRQEFVIGGWTEGEGSRTDSIGALLVGHYDMTAAEAKQQGVEQKLVYAGSVGTGFTQARLREIAKLLQEHACDETSFDIKSPGSLKPIGKWQAMSARKKLSPQQIHHVRPELVCEIEFTEFTNDGTLRHPSFKGLRFDKPAPDVIREEPDRG